MKNDQAKWSVQQTQRHWKLKRQKSSLTNLSTLKKLRRMLFLVRLRIKANTVELVFTTVYVLDAHETSSEHSDSPISSQENPTKSDSSIPRFLAEEASSPNQIRAFVEDEEEDVVSGKMPTVSICTFSSLPLYRAHSVFKLLTTQMEIYFIFTDQKSIRNTQVCASNTCRLSLSLQFNSICRLFSFFYLSSTLIQFKHGWQIHPKLVS